MIGPPAEPATANKSSAGERMMREQIERRLEELRHEYEAGAKLLSERETKQATIHATLTRISGAIQVLEEELSKADQLRNGGVKVGVVDGSLGDSNESPPPPESATA
jgi:hypothetical protein